MIVKLIAGLVMMGFIIFDISFNRPEDDSWTPTTTFWFFKNLFYAIVAIALIVTAQPGE